ncbi:hypothetical protein B0H66DRAFT_470400 [Apodospora peruviana]|uniref:Uncharacterized protein n=1 Tax=Apodospora peruviana TaxID=516989 RepID=A0AAE0IH86_9PEZI|nr:hypothetical protein B0H66DRAFT_470400 [Apodospora peruviana]
MDITDSPASSSNIQPQLPQPIPTIILPQQQRLKRDHDSISEEEEISSSPDPQNNNAGGKSRKKRGPFQDPEQQRETGLTRKLKACIRCSLQRIRCLVDPKAPNGCCRTCLEVARTRLHWLPCLRYRITDAQVLDHGICPRPTWTTRWKKMEIIEIKEWASKKIKTVRITQDVAGLSYELKVRQFVPVEGDSLARKWKTKGIEQEYECTPWAMANMREAGRTLAQFVDRSLGDAVCFYVDESDRLLRNTYLMAYRYSLFAEREEERLLLRAVLRLWCASRMETRSDRICGEETLGMQPRHYEPPCANDGLILTSPVFSAQMEVVMTSLLLQPAKKEVLKRLKDLVMENQRRSWFAIYLTMFILLHSCSLLTAADNKKARKQGLEHRFFRLSLVEELHNGAKVLLAYFHHCNKGGHPFTMDWSSEDQMVRGELNKEQAQFMRETAEQLKAKGMLFSNGVRKEGKFEHDYYFISQLYDFEWKPFHTV